MEKEGADPADMGALIRGVVREYCAREDVSQAELARRAGIVPPTLTRSFGSKNAAYVLRRVCIVAGLRVALVPNK